MNTLRNDFYRHAYRAGERIPVKAFTATLKKILRICDFLKKSILIIAGRYYVVLAKY